MCTSIYIYLHRRVLLLCAFVCVLGWGKYGMCVEDRVWLCVKTRWMEGGCEEVEERKKAAGGLGTKDLSSSHPHIIVVGVASTVQQIYH